jgi:hypothetical protein
VVSRLNNAGLPFRPLTTHHLEKDLFLRHYIIYFCST